MNATTLPPPRRERMNVEAFEALIKTRGEPQARLQNLQAETRTRTS
jgi:hypothetical protein